MMRLLRHILIITFSLVMFLIAWKAYTKETNGEYRLRIEGDIHYLSEYAIKDKVSSLLRERENNVDPLTKIEQELKENDWIKNIAIYKDLSNTICVKIEEKEVALRIFSKEQLSFFVAMDEKLDIIKSTSARVPRAFICLNFPIYPKIDTPALHFLLDFSNELRNYEEVAKHFSHFNYINSSTIEVVNTFGGLTVVISPNNHPTAVINQLNYFYQYIIPAKGWTYYKTLNFKFRNQVIAVKN